MGVAKVPGGASTRCMGGRPSPVAVLPGEDQSGGPVSTRAGTGNVITYRVQARQETGPPGGTEKPPYPFALFTYETRKVWRTSSRNFASSFERLPRVFC